MIPQIFNLNRRLNFKKRAQPYFKDHDFYHKQIFLDHLDRLSMINSDMSSICCIDVPDYFLDLPETHALKAHKKISQIIQINRDSEVIPENLENQDAIIALLTCHSVNDLVGYFIQIRNALKEDGVFIASFFGDKILSLLNTAFKQAELATKGGASHHCHPTIDIRDLGHLAQRAGLTLPVVDADAFRVHYKKIDNLITDIRGMGENNALSDLPTPMSQKTYQLALEYIAQQVPDHLFMLDYLTLTARKASEKQQKPLKPGSAAISLTQIL